MASLTMATGVEVTRSRLENSRPERSAIPAVSKKPESTVLTIARTVSDFDRCSRPSTSSPLSARAHSGMLADQAAEEGVKR